MIDLSYYLESKKDLFPYNYKRLIQLMNNGLNTKNIVNFCSLLRQMQLTNTKIKDCEKISLPYKFLDFEDIIKQNNYETIKLKEKLVITPKYWIPKNLKFINNVSDILEQWMELKTQRKDFSKKADPFIQEIFSYQNYSSQVQKEALIQMMFIKEGEVLIGNIPTGSGKSLLFQLPVLKNGLQKGLTLVVVPTIALAMDQERRIKELFEHNKIICTHRLAYHSGLNEEEKINIRNNIKQNRQGILFVSPESVVSSLLPSLFIACEGGHLRYLFIDEAHLLADWGDTFRTGYQKLFSIRNGLIEKNTGLKFKTVLLSATFNPVNIDLINNLFGPIDKIHFISSIFLRPEPKYYVAKFENKEDKIAKFLDIINYVPRPCIIYTTTITDADNIKNKILSIGYDNVYSFTGSTNPHDRETISTLWNNDEIDFLVATSAFGVGIDKSNVRTVLHMTVPETLERFYQEVGRSGRDGKNSNSIVLYCEDDYKIAQKIAAGDPRDIAGSENAYLRWFQMKKSSVKYNNTYRIFDISKIPEHLDKETDKNEQHNFQTLLLMARIGKISVSKPSLPSQEGLFDIDWKEYDNKFLVNEMGSINFEETDFKDNYSKSRSLISENRQNSLNLLKLFLEGKSSVEDSLEKVFNNNDYINRIKVSKVCRGCTIPHAPRKLNREPIITGTKKIKSSSPHISVRRNRIFIGDDINNICDERIIRAIEIFYKKYNIKHFLITESYDEQKNKFFNEINLKFKNNEIFLNLVQEFIKNPNLNEVFYNLPTVTIFYPMINNNQIPTSLISNFKNNVFLIPKNLSYDGNKFYRDVYSDTLDLDEFILQETY